MTNDYLIFLQLINKGVAMYWLQFVLITVLSFNLLGCVAKNVAFKKTFYKNGQLNQIWNYQEGFFRKHYENGALNTEGQLNNGVSDGLWKVYYESGELYEENNYKDGRREGLSRRYFKNGAIQAEGMFKKDIPVGVFNQYFKSGKIYCQWDYSRHIFTEYDEDGSVMVKKKF